MTSFSHLTRHNGYVSPPKREEFNLPGLGPLSARFHPEKSPHTVKLLLSCLPSRYEHKGSYLAFGARWVGGAMAACPDMMFLGSGVFATISQGKVSLRPPEVEPQQRELLEFEGVVFDEHDRVDLKKYTWLGENDQ